MKNINFLFLFIIGIMFLISTDAISQAGRKVAPFRITLSNGSVFKAENLPSGKPIVIIYFSPECEDCQKMTEEMLKRMNDFRKASIVMVTYLPVETLKPFIARYSLNMYPNIYIGTEGSAFIVRYYYNITTFPFIAFFNTNGDLIKSYTKEGNIDEMASILKNL